MKPINGWRVFWGEVGIIVLGVLIALGAQQLASDWDDRRRARESLAAVEAELALNAKSFEERTFQQPCMDRRLNELTQILADARRTGRLPRIDGIGQSLARSMRDHVRKSVICQPLKVQG
ncbi:hypothetical protein H9L13_09850 [Sphingomonas lutea]|uniref:Uncharacterized protein n=1 Tax=Sphingomonas lutea TaxID=1045317 RepID=A0A7G9SGG9_9SPHN|nr:hypothetical protein [Sphingomonas lutea]QNN66944.1 hypothetical protein H9L13_09850 [Sphingomonas lutea]